MIRLLDLSIRPERFGRRATPGRPETGAVAVAPRNRRLPRKLLLTALAPLLLLAACAQEQARTPSPAGEQPEDALRLHVEREIEALDAMRSGLAATIGEDPVDQETFARVCQPVGRQARQLAEANGWEVRQMAERYRNSAHQLDEGGARAYARFEQDPALERFWVRTEGETPGWRYFHRITVEEACLACHGPEEERPDFVKANYPEDRAFGFEAGDLRGLYAVRVPDTTRATSAP